LPLGRSLRDVLVQRKADAEFPLSRRANYAYFLTYSAGLVFTMDLPSPHPAPA